VRGLLFVGLGLVVLAVACGEDKAQYSYADSIGCLKGVGKTETSGRGQTAVRVTTDDSKTFDLLFLPSGQPAKNYAKRLNVTNGILHTKGNVIVYGHQTGNGPDVSDDDMDEVEKCVA
jgi:hypothetical protein